MNDETVTVMTDTLFKRTLMVGDASSNLMAAVLGTLVRKGLLSEDELRDEIIEPVKNICFDQLSDDALSDDEQDGARFTLLQLKNLAGNLGLLSDELQAELTAKVPRTRPREQ